MPGSKFAIALALALASSAPAFAGMNGTDYLNYIDAMRRSQTTQQTSQARVEWQGTWASTGAILPQRAPEAVTKSYPHRYYGGPKSIH